MYSHIVAALGALALHAGHAAAQTTVSFNTNTKYQTMDGFGFSEAFGFGGAVQNAASTQQNEALNLLFSTTSGAGMTILRNRIGADSGSTIEPNSPGGPNNTPTYRALNGDSSQVFWSQKARAMGVKYIYADAWSAPGFMKTTGSYEGGGYLCGVTGETCSSGDWRQAYANYIVQYLNDYKAQGITVDFVGFLNEPEYAASYDAMLSDGTQAASFIPILKKTIDAAGLSTGITCCDAEGWTDQVKFTQQLQAAGVESDLARITSHWYLSKATGPMDTTLRVWETEYADLDDAFVTTWHSSGAFNEGFTWAQLIYQGVVTSNLSAFLYWVGAQANSNAAALVSLNGSDVVASGSLWAFAMYSRFIRPDAVRIATSGAPANTQVGAFQNTDGSIAVILLNAGSGSQSVSIPGVSGSATAYVMDNSVSSPTALSVNVSGGSAALTLPGYSMVTVVIKGGSSSSSPPPSSTHSSAPATSSTSPPSTGGGTAGHWDQCGGSGYTGPTQCASPYTCTVVNPYYSQCL